MRPVAGASRPMRAASLVCVAILACAVIPRSAILAEKKPMEESASPVESGRRLVSELGCPVCHEIPGVETSVREEAPDLSYEGQLVRPDWLFGFLKSPQRIRPAVKGRMPDFRLTDEEALAITEYLASLNDPEALEVPQERRYKGAPSPELVEAGRRLTSAEYLSCFKCHILGDQRPGGEPSEWAPDLTRVRQRLMPEGILSWIRNPPRYRPNTKMPVFFPDQDSGPEDILGGDEDLLMTALRDFVVSIGLERSFDGLAEARAAFPWVRPSDGRSLMVKLNCVGCHNVADLPDGKKVGPSLGAEGSRVRPAWLAEFLGRPWTIKPEYELMGSLARMPDFHLTGDEMKVLTTYVTKELTDKEASRWATLDAATAGQAERGEGLFEEKQCHNCHRIGLRAGGIGPNLTQAEERLAPDWVFHFIQNPSHYLETRMPNLQVTEDEARAITAYLMSPKGR